MIGVSQMEVVMAIQAISGTSNLDYWLKAQEASSANASAGTRKASGGGGTSQASAASGSSSSSESDTSQIYDVRDTNQDGVVSYMEQLLYELKHPSGDTSPLEDFMASQQSSMNYNQQGQTYAQGQSKNLVNIGV